MHSVHDDGHTIELILYKKTTIPSLIIVARTEKERHICWHSLRGHCTVLVVTDDAGEWFGQRGLYFVCSAFGSDRKERLSA